MFMEPELSVKQLSRGTGKGVEVHCLGCLLLQVASRSGKWQCPVSMRVCSAKTLVQEPYVAAILKAVSTAGVDIDEVEVGPGGCWPRLGGTNLHPPGQSPSC
jgi:hypothetical protein